MRKNQNEFTLKLIQVNPSLVVENPAHRSKQRKQEQERLNRMRAGQAAALGGLSQSDSVWAMKVCILS